MKKLISTMMIAFVAFASFAQQDVAKKMDAVKINKSAVPGPVIQQAEKDFPNVSPFKFYSVGETAVSKDWKVSEDIDFHEGEKVDHYSIEMKGKDTHYEALYDAKGKLLMSKEYQKDVALPQPVLQSISKDYPGMGLKKDVHSKVTDHGMKKEYYVVSLDNGKKLTYLPDGTLKK